MTMSHAVARTPLGMIWRFLTSKVTAIGLILTLGVLTLLGTLFPQLPDSARGNSMATAAWLDGIRPRFGDATDWLARMQVFGVFHSLTFTTTAAVLGVSTLACTINRTPALWRQVARPPLHPSGHLLDQNHHSRRVVVATDPASVTASVAAHLRGRYHLVTTSTAEATDLYAVRHRFAPLATLVAHAGIVLVLAAAAVTGQVAFRDSEVAVVVGERHAVGHDTGLVIEAASFTDSYTEAGTPLDYASDLKLLADGRPVARATVRVNEPLRYDDIAIYQSFYGVAAVLQVSDSTGTTLFDGGVPLKWGAEDGIHTVGLLDLPLPGEQLAVVSTVSGKRDPLLRAGQVQIVTYRGGAETDRRVISTGVATDVGGLRVTFLRERQFTGLTVARDPGSLWVWWGAALLLVGMTITFSMRPRRLWVRITAHPSGSQVHVVTPARTTPTDADLHDPDSATLDELIRALTPASVETLPDPALIRK